MHKKLDPTQVVTRPNTYRESKVCVADVLDPETWVPSQRSRELTSTLGCVGLAAAICEARRNLRPVVFFISGHVIKHGLSLYICDLIQRGLITHVACNGSVMIHDWELAFVGSTSEDVGRYLPDGSFGNWETPEQLNRAIPHTNHEQMDWSTGENLGYVIKSQAPPEFSQVSVLKTCYENEVPCTVHVSIGCDINHQYGNVTPKLFEASYSDFLILGGTVHEMTGGVFVNIGSQVTGPEVFLKSLSMARNVRRYQLGEERPLADITTAILDFVQLPGDWRQGTASEGDAAYYYRPWKTLLLRAVADGGRSHYLGGKHVDTVPALWQAINQQQRMPKD